MTIDDKLFTYATDAVVLKGSLMTSIADKVRRTVIKEICRIETETMDAQQWKVETATEKKEEFKQKRESKYTKYSP